jgi:hypothetical protein
MKTWVRKLSSFEEEQNADREFWSRITPNERVAIVEELRQDWARMQGNDEDLQGLRRTARVVQRPER